MVKIRNIASGPFEGTRSANGAQEEMNSIAGDSRLATNWAASASARSGLVTELKPLTSRNRNGNTLANAASLSNERRIGSRNNMDAEPALCARQEPA